MRKVKSVGGLFSISIRRANGKGQNDCADHCLCVVGLAVPRCSHSWYPTRGGFNAGAGRSCRLFAVCCASALSECLAAMKRIIEIEDLPLEPNTVSSRSIGMAGNAGCGQIQFNQVPFAYANRPVLQDVSFSAGLGLTVLVGPSGAGKTTVLSLIERFAEADTGKVMLDGRDVCEFDLDVLRSRLAYVQQE